MYHSSKTVQAFIGINEFSRSGRKMESQLGVVMHWVNNAGTTAKQNRNYFDTLSGAYASTQYVVDDIQAIAVIPDNEVAFHVGAEEYTPLGRSFLDKFPSPNYCLLGIEMCHNKDGTFKEETLKLAASLAAEKLVSYGNGIKDLHRHGDIVQDKGVPRKCPKYFMENPEEWEKFKARVFVNILAMKKLPDYKYLAVKDSIDRGLLMSKDWLDKVNDNTPVWMTCTVANRLYDMIELLKKK